MPARYWLFLAAVLGALAVIAGAIGAHALASTAQEGVQIYRTGQTNHAIHALALFATGLLMLQSEGRRTKFGTITLQLAAAWFTIGILLFSGGIYGHVAGGYESLVKFICGRGLADRGLAGPGCRRAGAPQIAGTAQAGFFWRPRARISPRGSPGSPSAFSSPYSVRAWRRGATCGKSTSRWRRGSCCSGGGCTDEAFAQDAGFDAFDGLVQHPFEVCNLHPRQARIACGRVANSTGRDAPGRWSHRPAAITGDAELVLQTAHIARPAL